ncbi:MAG: DNA polymerase III subunit beta [Patescibacteria group bacterium]
MRFTALLENIKKAFLIAEKGLGKSNNLPVLSSFLIEVNKSEINISSTNLELGIKTSFSGKVEKEGKIVVAARPLIAFLSQLNEPKIEVISDEKKLKISTESYQAEFQSYETEEFPIIPEVKDNKILKMESPLLAAALEQVIIASSRSDFRPELASLFLFLDQSLGLKLTATDTFRLAEKTLNFEDFQPLTKNDFKCLIPLKTAEEIIRIAKEKLEPVEISVDPNQIQFSWKETKLVSRLLEGEFPDYDSVVPKSFEAQAIVSYGKLLESLKITGIFASKLNDVKLNLDIKAKKISLSASDSFIGQNQGKIELDSAKGQDREIIFNYRYLLDSLAVLDPKDKIFIGFTTAEKPALIRQENDSSYFYILMPLRI